MENKVTESMLSGVGIMRKEGSQALGNGSGRNRKYLAWFPKSLPFPWPLWNQKGFFRELSGRQTDNPTKLFRWQPEDLRVSGLLFSKTDTVNEEEKRWPQLPWAQILDCPPPLLWPDCLSPSLSSPQAIPTSLLETFQKVHIPILYE